MGRFQDKVVLITGASGGVGIVLIQAFEQEGAKVAALYHENKPLVFSPESVAVKADLADPKSAKSAMDKCLERFGQIDILINGAAITINNFTEKTEPEDWRKVIATNLDSAFYVTRAILPEMKKRKSGHIINISSIVGEIGAVGCSPYVASKAGLVGLTKAVAKETARYGIFVNALLLGYFEAGLGLQFTQELKQKIVSTIPLGYFGDPQEVVKAIFFLAETRYMTGATLRLSGGL